MIESTLHLDGTYTLSITGPVLKRYGVVVEYVSDRVLCRAPDLEGELAAIGLFRVEHDAFTASFVYTGLWRSEWYGLCLWAQKYYWSAVHKLWEWGLLEPTEATQFSWSRDFSPFPWRGGRRERLR